MSVRGCDTWTNWASISRYSIRVFFSTSVPNVPKWTSHSAALTTAGWRTFGDRKRPAALDVRPSPPQYAGRAGSIAVRQRERRLRRLYARARRITAHNRSILLSIVRRSLPARHGHRAAPGERQLGCG